MELFDLAVLRRLGVFDDPVLVFFQRALGHLEGSLGLDTAEAFGTETALRHLGVFDGDFVQLFAVRKSLGTDLFDVGSESQGGELLHALAGAGLDFCDLVFFTVCGDRVRDVQFLGVLVGRFDERRGQLGVVQLVHAAGGSDLVSKDHYIHYKVKGAVIP